MRVGSDQLSTGEIAKDAIQAGVAAGLTMVGRVGMAVLRAIGEIGSAVGDLATDLFEIWDYSERAVADQQRVRAELRLAEDDELG